MSECSQRAILIVTRNVEGTATHIARRRVELQCRLERGHAGPHSDSENGEQWEALDGHTATLLRQESEE